MSGRHLLRRRQHRFLFANRGGHPTHQPTFPQAVGTEHHPARAGDAQQAAQHDGGVTEGHQTGGAARQAAVPAPGARL